MIVYIHGFNSSSASAKARVMQEALLHLNRGHEFFVLDLPYLPSLAMQKLEQEITKHGAKQVALIGSSLGGHYATWLAEKLGMRAVLVNPAVNPHLLLAPCLGPQKNLHTGEQYQYTQQHLTELEQFNVSVITRPERYLLLVQTGDELLDYRQAVEKYRGTRQVVIEGGDHGFRNFSDYVPMILKFAAE
ncbi:MAG: YqiA/YcfP family alpha/beta fold hydrolase [Burkholderiales bacterium]